ncbi:hypothetical protein ACH4ND_20060 [Streptomyces sp. NPDC017179]|uniref:hypothetical protein n=1 Tax=Streptomyces sp. NPDC017179 TaxID=3364979 RepID=UPI003790DCEE
MTPGLRAPLRATVLLIALAAAVPASGSAWAYGPERTPSASATPYDLAPAPATGPSGAAASDISASGAATSGAATSDTVAPEVAAGFRSSPVHGTSPSSVPASPPSSPSASASASASAAPPSPSSDPSRAGSRPGEGRLRPGRPHDRRPEHEDDDTDGPGEHDHRGEDFGSDSATAEAPSVSPSGQEAAPLPSGTDRPGDLPIAQDETDTGPVLRYLPLGSGLVLIGLGLGLAFIALRMRRS